VPGVREWTEICSTHSDARHFSSEIPEIFTSLGTQNVLQPVQMFIFFFLAAENIIQESKFSDCSIRTDLPLDSVQLWFEQSYAEALYNICRVDWQA